MILLARFQKGGADSRLCPSQFGFRRGRGTSDALFLARRFIERTWARKDARLAVLILDWVKVFDSISPASLYSALARFGIPQPMIEMIKSIYTGRHFIVRDGNCSSSMKVQHFGISQGCPLSPFLFVIMMSILVEDARHILKQQFGHRADLVLEIDQG